MAIPSTGPITMKDIENEYGGSGSISLSEYYRGGQYVPNHTGTSKIPTSGAISMGDFRGTQKANPTPPPPPPPPPMPPWPPSQAIP